MPCPHPSSEDGWWHSLALMGCHSWQSPEMPAVQGNVAQGTGESQSRGSGGPGSSGASPAKAHSTHPVTRDLCLAAPALRTPAATSLAVHSSICVLPLARPPPQSQRRHFRTCPNSRCRKRPHPAPTSQPGVSGRFPAVSEPGAADRGDGGLLAGPLLLLLLLANPSQLLFAFQTLPTF